MTQTLWEQFIYNYTDLVFIGIILVPVILFGLWVTKK